MDFVLSQKNAPCQPCTLATHTQHALLWSRLQQRRGWGSSSTLRGMPPGLRLSQRICWILGSAYFRMRMPTSQPYQQVARADVPLHPQGRHELHDAKQLGVQVALECTAAATQCIFSQHCTWQVRAVRVPVPAVKEKHQHTVSPPPYNRKAAEWPCRCCSHPCPGAVLAVADVGAPSSAPRSALPAHHSRIHQPALPGCQEPAANQLDVSTPADLPLSWPAHETRGCSAFIPSISLFMCSSKQGHCLHSRHDLHDC